MNSWPTPQTLIRILRVKSTFAAAQAFDRSSRYIIDSHRIRFWSMPSNVSSLDEQFLSHVHMCIPVLFHFFQKSYDHFKRIDDNGKKLKRRRICRT